MLQEMLLKCHVIDLHRELVRTGCFAEAQIVFKLLRNRKVTLGLDDASWAVERALEKIGCHMWYAGNGNTSVAYLTIRRDRK